MVMYGGRWAHAHDVAQDAFMRLAAMYAAAHPRYRDLPWFREWWQAWLESAGNQGNGVSDILLTEHLTDTARIELFREFLGDYREWIAAVGSVVEYEFRIAPEKALGYARLVEAVVIGDGSHPLT